MIDKPKEVDVALIYKALEIITSAVGPELSYLVLTNNEVPELSALIVCSQTSRCTSVQGCCEVKEVGSKTPKCSHYGQVT